MLKIGLTGGIGSGKTTVAQFFSRLNIPIIDADIIAHQLVTPGQIALKSLVENFGTDILNTDGSLARDKLRTLIFSDVAKKKQLETLVHPLIYAEIATQLTQIKADYCVICIPLLIETQKTEQVDRILVIDCPLEMQIERVKNRNQLTESQIYAIIATQASREQRLAVADDVIDNNLTSTAYLVEQVKNLHNLYHLLSSA